MDTPPLPVLHHACNTRSFRPLWTLEALGVPYRLEMLPFPPRVLKKDYLAINPLGTVPAFSEGQVRMTESAAICQYLADRHDPGGLGVAADEPDYGAYLNWLHFGEATLTFPQTLVLRYRRFEPEARRLPQAADDYAKWFLARARAIGPILDRGFVCAGRFTAADIVIGYAFMLAGLIGLGDDLPDPAKAYWARLQDQPSYRAALAAQARAAEAQGVALDWMGA
jgi:glutathione S-transferase